MPCMLFSYLNLPAESLDIFTAQAPCAQLERIGRAGSDSQPQAFVK